MPSIGKYTAKKTEIVADIFKINVNGDPIYTFRIDGKIYKLSEEDFNKKWKPYSITKKRVETVQEDLF